MIHGFVLIIKHFFLLPFDVMRNYSAAVREFREEDLTIERTDTPILSWMLKAGRGIVLVLASAYIFAAAVFFLRNLFSDFSDAVGALLLAGFLFPFFVVVLGFFLEVLTLSVQAAHDLQTLARGNVRGVGGSAEHPA